jgi:hypothetical protein
VLEIFRKNGSSSPIHNIMNKRAFFCLLFGGESVWITNECTNLKYLALFKIESKFDEGSNVAIERNNDLTDKKYKISEQNFTFITFCGVHALALCGQ